MYRILKVCRSIIKETELAIVNTTEESYYYNVLGE